jgi:tungstate transport system ATP-binding protein|tara:strand:+ start:25 stop:732 length:708 start_codon:yes stop_codon:yes gene_type:complete
MKDFIKINNLILFSNKGEGNLIDIPNLQFDSKSISVIIGPNGAGKSLLLNIIQGLILPSAGTIKIKSSIKDKSCKKVSIMMQRPSFLRRTTEQNIQFVLELNKDKIKVSYLDVLERFDLIAQRKILANKLSGGEKQRLALALAIITNSKILLLDEPTANADPRTTIKIEKIIKEEAIAGKKILLVTHNIPQAKRLGQDIAFIHRGKVLEHCDKAVFVNHPKVKEINQFLEGEVVI